MMSRVSHVTNRPYPNDVTFFPPKRSGSARLGHLTMESCNIPRAPVVTPPTNVSRPQTLARSLSRSPNEWSIGGETSATYSPGKTGHLVYKLHPQK